MYSNEVMQELMFLKHLFERQPVEREVTSKCCIIGEGKDFDAGRNRKVAL